MQGHCSACDQIGKGLVQATFTGLLQALHSIVDWVHRFYTVSISGIWGVCITK